MSKLVLIGVGAAAYVLGARAGRERYEQIARATQRVRNNPKVRDSASKAGDFAKQKAPEVTHQVADTARGALHKAHRNNDLTPGTRSPA